MQAFLSPCIYYLMCLTNVLKYLISSIKNKSIFHSDIVFNLTHTWLRNILYLILAEHNKYILHVYSTNTSQNIFDRIFLVLYYYKKTDLRFCEIHINKSSNKLVLTEIVFLNDKK